MSSHAQYNAAKGQRDVYCALNILNDLAQERVVLGLRDIAIASGVTPKIIAPSAQVGDSNNALAIGYAQWLGHELDWPVEERVFQSKTVSKDREGAWFRLAHQSTFYGEIDSKASYVIVDDVVTLGGTLADLRSFIIGKGAKVIAMSAIASGTGADKQIRLGDGTRDKLEKHYGSSLASDCSDILGFPHTCLTNDEAGRLLGCSGYVEFRKNIQRERDKAAP
ncbi:MAG: hypothetical protein JNL14_08280 [Devosia sp.]|uniref:hypothetical protein n=1 Tax=Devosia sp. TaxID=1871048 RepID=UPI001A536551|nr:hypothetical protein [Devosia sp.]MBL8597720.1 hypothetical protein [Devosia sp.]